MILTIPKILITWLIVSVLFFMPSILYFVWVYLYTLAFGNSPSEYLQIFLLATVFFYTIIFSSAFKG